MDLWDGIKLVSSPLDTLRSSYRSSFREQAFSSCSLTSEHPPQGTEGHLVGRKQHHHVISRVSQLQIFPIWKLMLGIHLTGNKTFSFYYKRSNNQMLVNVMYSHHKPKNPRKTGCIFKRTSSSS